MEVLTFILWWVHFAFVAVAGGVAIVGTQVKSGDLLGGYADTVLTVEYQQKSIYEIVMSFVNQDVDYYTLGGLSDVTPLVDVMLDKIAGTIEDSTGFAINIDELKTKSWSEIPQYLGDEAKHGIKVAKLVGVDEGSDNIMKTLCYPKKGDGTFDYDNPYSISDILDDEHFIQNKIDTMTIKDVIGESSEGSSKAIKSIENKTISELKNDDVIGELLLSDVIDINDSSAKILRTFKEKETKVKDMSTVIDSLYLSDVYESKNPESLPPVMKKLLGNEGEPAHREAGVVEIDYEKYEEVIFSNGNDKTASTYKATDYVKIKDFIGAETIEIQEEGGAFVVVNHGSLDRSAIDPRIFDIEVVAPSGWDVYATSCNKPTKINDLDKSIDDLTLKDVVKLETTSPLYKVRHSSVKNADTLFEDIKTSLTIKDIFGADMNKYKFINKLDETTTINNIGDAINNMKLIDAFDENIYQGAADDEHATLKSMWKYLLIESDETWIEGNPERGDNPFETYACSSYTVGGKGDGTPGNPKGIDQMMTNMKYWMENQKLKVLQADGMVHIEGDLLTSDIPATIRALDTAGTIVPATAVKYGDLTTKQFVELMTKVPALKTGAI